MGLKKLMVNTKVIENKISYCSSQEKGRFGRGKANENIHDSEGSIKNDIRKRNPVNSYDKIIHCNIYESIYHWAKECPNK